MMTALEIVTLSLSVLSALTLLVGGIGTLVKNSGDRRKGIADTQQAGKRDAAEVQNQIIDQVQELLDKERAMSEAQMGRLDSRVQLLDTKLEDEKEYNSQLIVHIQGLNHHIYTQKPPPPPPIPQRFGLTAQPVRVPPPPQHI